jgi:hypothetical protein
MIPARTLGHSLTLVFLAALLGACASGPEIRSHADPGANFNAYQSFGFFDEVTGHKAPYSSFVTQHVKDAIASEMQSRGYRRDASPELMINFHLETQNQVSVTQTAAPPTGYYGYRRGFYGWAGTGTMYETDIQSYKEGTLNIDIVDAAAKKLLWEGIAVDRVTAKALENPKPVIEDAVKQMFEKFPGRR